MRPELLRAYLLAGEAERDAGFCQEIFRLGCLGLKVTGGIEIGVAVAMLLTGMVQPGVQPLWLWEAAVLAGLGIATLLVARAAWSYEWSRLLGMVSVLAAALVLIGFSLRMHDAVAAAGLLTGEAALVMLVAVMSLPLRPVQTLVLGTATACGYALLARQLDGAGGLHRMDLPFLAVATVVSTGLTVIAYRQRHLAYGAYTGVVRACEDLRESQARMLVSENAASMARLAAALSHELNTPMGALVSGVSSLMSLAAKQATATPAQQERLAGLQTELCRMVQDSAKRLQETVRRMQRFTNLDKTEVQPANLNELLGDVAALLQPEIEGKAKLEFDFQPVSILLVRPQQLSAVFSSLLNNAANALNHEGSIVISTRQQDSRVEVQIRDNGRGVAPGQTRGIFDPGFKVVDGRVLTGNWQMFHSRQIIREHGGEIRIASEEGRGTTVTVTLPVIRAPA